MPKFKLTLAYDGTAYHGWQSQKSGRGVADPVEAALARLFPSAPKLVSSSRTDTGVHAMGLVAHFEIPPDELRMPARQLALAINSGLPDDIQRMVAIVVLVGFGIALMVPPAGDRLEASLSRLVGAPPTGHGVGPRTVDTPGASI